MSNLFVLILRCTGGSGVKNANSRKDSVRSSLKRRRADSIPRGRYCNDRQRNVSKFELRADFDNTDDTEQYGPDQNSTTSHSTTSRITWTRGPSKFELCGDFDITDDTGEPASDQDSTSHSGKAGQKALRHLQR